MERQTIIFVHGGQGCGKSTVTNLLREKMTHTTLFRLAGVPTNQEEPHIASLRYHMAMLEGVNQSRGSGMNFIFDRSYLCEKVYANLGFKPHSFEEECRVITNGIETLAKSFNIYFVLLTATERTLTHRLKRDGKPQFEDVKFSAENSLKQQMEYLYEFDYLPETVGMMTVPTDNMGAEEVADFIIERIFKLEQHEEKGEV